MINKWDDDINNAIVAVGGKTYGSGGLPDYADIIRAQLVANTAVGEGIYQDFLYVDENLGLHSYPWDGAPTDSTNAVQSKVVADAISKLYDTMALTERFQVLLVDEFPTSEVNLSSIYLVRKKCGCGDPDCTCECENENLYQGCYYVKAGKKIRRVDIEDFEFDLDHLFFVPREEYKQGIKDYTEAIEELLRKKFGRYWNDEGFALDETIDKVIADMAADLQAKSDEIIANVNTIVSDTLDQLTVALDEAKQELKDSFKDLETEVGQSLSGMQATIDNLNERVETVEGTVDQFGKDLVRIDNEMKENFVTLESGLNTKLQEFQSGVEEDLDTRFAGLQASVDESVNSLTTRVTNVETDVAEFKEETDTKIANLNTSVDERFSTMNQELGEFQTRVEEDLDTRFTNLKADVDSAVDTLTSDMRTLESNVETFKEETNKSMEDLTASVAKQFEDLGAELDEQFSELESGVQTQIDGIDGKVDNLSSKLDEHKADADLKYLSKTDIISVDQLNELK
jgi:DNA anti-recombination protein RmuC